MRAMCHNCRDNTPAAEYQNRTYGHRVRVMNPSAAASKAAHCPVFFCTVCGAKHVNPKDVKTHHGGEIVRPSWVLSENAAKLARRVAIKAHNAALAASR